VSGTGAPAAGDDLLPEANLVFDHATVLDAAPERIWPWLVQLGKVPRRLVPPASGAGSAAAASRGR
jgi:hypothetical protein